MGISFSRSVRRISIALTIVALVGVTAAAEANSRRATFSTISNRAHVMAVRNGKEFVHFARGSHRNCFGVTKGGATPLAFTCWDDFPSAAHPILDQSTFGADAGEPMHVIEVDGFAADGVNEIDVTDGAGTVLARTPVLRNVYSLGAVPLSAVRIAAVDASGRTVFAVPR